MLAGDCGFESRRRCTFFVRVRVHFNYNKIKAGVIDEEEEEGRSKEKKNRLKQNLKSKTFLMSFRYNTKARYIHNAMFLS